MKKYLPFLLLIAVILIGASVWGIIRNINSATPIAPQPQSPSPIAQAVYICDGGKTLDATFYKGEIKPVEVGEPPIPTGSVKLNLSDGRKFDLPQTISADGGRYANSDESFVFWSKGDGAIVLENGKETDYTGCIVAEYNSSTPIKKLLADPQNATYVINDQQFTLVDGESTKNIPDSTLKITTQYFGNETKGDFNSDNKEDIAFLMTQNAGGTGTFYYLAVVLGTNEGFNTTNTVLIGDRIAPQNTAFTNEMIVVNYADRKPNEPFSVNPSVGVSKYFKVIDNKIVEITLKISEAEARAIAEKMCIKGGEALSVGTYNENSHTWWFDANLNTTREGCNPACVVNEDTKTAEINWRCTGLILPK